MKLNERRELAISGYTIVTNGRRSGTREMILCDGAELVHKYHGDYYCVIAINNHNYTTNNKSICDKYKAIDSMMNSAVDLHPLLVELHQSILAFAEKLSAVISLDVDPDDLIQAGIYEEPPTQTSTTTRIVNGVKVKVGKKANYYQVTGNTNRALTLYDKESAQDPSDYFICYEDGGVSFYMTNSSIYDYYIDKNEVVDDSYICVARYKDGEMSIWYRLMGTGVTAAYYLNQGNFTLLAKTLIYEINKYGIRSDYFYINKDEEAMTYLLFTILDKHIHFMLDQLTKM